MGHAPAQHTTFFMTRLFVASFLGFSLLAAGEGDNPAGKVRVLYSGIRWDASVPETVQRNMEIRVESILRGHRKTLDTMILKDQSQPLAAGEQSGYTAACDSGYDYIFSGAISNPQPEQEEVLLVGELTRYNCADGTTIRFEITKYYKAIGVELLKFDQQMVASIIPAGSKSETRLAGWVFLGVIFAFIIVLSFVSISVSGDGGDGGVPPIDTT